MELQTAQTTVLELRIQSNSIPTAICTVIHVMTMMMAIQSEMIGMIAHRERPAGFHLQLPTMIVMDAETPLKT